MRRRVGDERRLVEPALAELRRAPAAAENLRAVACRFLDEPFDRFAAARRGERPEIGVLLERIAES
jgi:hypothetical protein